jgi:hypothetical protein
MFIKLKFLGYSADYKLLLQTIQFYGEVASFSNRMALNSGVNFMPHQRFLVTLFYRNYPTGHISPYSNALGENSSVENEKGVFTGLQWKTNWKIDVSGYVDIFTFPWPGYRADAPTKGKEYLVESVFRPVSDFTLTIRYKQQVKGRNILETESASVYSVKDFLNHNVRIHFRYQLSNDLIMSTRVEWSESGYSGEAYSPGLLLYHDIAYSFTNKLRLNFRYAWFDIKDYDSRIYAYEHNVRYAYSMPAYFGKGTRLYVVLKYAPLNWLKVGVRFGHTNYFDEITPGKNEATLQGIIRF